MMAPMKYRLMSCYITLALLLAPVLAFAKGEDEDAVKQEARLEGYQTAVHLPHGGNTLAVMLMVFLCVMALMAMLKNPKRTHLD